MKIQHNKVFAGHLIDKNTHNPIRLEEEVKTPENGGVGEESNFTDTNFTSFHTSPVLSQVDKFYLKYGKNWREMYIGGKL